MAFKKSFEKASQWIIGLASILLFIMMLLVTTEVVLRIFDNSTLISDEYGGYLLAGITFLGLAFSFKNGSFTRVDLIYQRLAKKKVGPILDKILLVLSLMYASLLCYTLFGQAKTSFTLSTKAPTVSQTPLYIPQSVLVIGGAVFIIQILVLLFSKNKTK